MPSTTSFTDTLPLVPNFPGSYTSNVTGIPSAMKQGAYGTLANFLQDPLSSISAVTQPLLAALQPSFAEQQQQMMDAFRVAGGGSPDMLSSGAFANAENLLGMEQQQQQAAEATQAALNFMSPVIGGYGTLFSGSPTLSQSIGVQGQGGTGGVSDPTGMLDTFNQGFGAPPGQVPGMPQPQVVSQGPSGGGGGGGNPNYNIPTTTGSGSSAGSSTGTGAGAGAGDQSVPIPSSAGLTGAGGTGYEPIYDPTTGTWVSNPNAANYLNPATSAFGGGFADINGQPYIFGVNPSDPNNTFQQMFNTDPSTGMPTTPSTVSGSIGPPSPLDMGISYGGGYSYL